MTKIKKFNESKNSIPTWNELLSLIDGSKVKLVNVNKSDIEDHLLILSKYNGGKDFGNLPVATSIQDGIADIDERFVIIFDGSNIPLSIISEYELMNPFVFGDIVICPGHDSITCYNKKTGEHIRSYIR